MNESELLKVFGQNVPFIVNTGLKAVRLSPEKIEVRMPFEPNKNHIGIMYAGALFTLAECTGAGVYSVYFKKEDRFPLVKGLNIRFKRPARTDLTCEYRMDAAELKRLEDDFETHKKADYTVQLELKDADGQVVAVCEGFYQFRQGKGL